MTSHWSMLHRKNDTNTINIKKKKNDKHTNLHLGLEYYRNTNHKQITVDCLSEVSLIVCNIWFERKGIQQRNNSLSERSGIGGQNTSNSDPMATGDQLSLIVFLFIFILFLATKQRLKL